MKTKLTGANVRFKSAPVGQSFTHQGQSYRKASSRGAYRLNPNGTGQTHALIPFARNSWVQV